MATADNGLAALVYSPCQVTAKVGEHATVVSVTEKTDYPFRGSVRFEVSLDEATQFPLHLRVPSWCDQAELKVNGQLQSAARAGRVAIIDRRWESGDVVELNLPMQLEIKRWHENSVGLRRGPLVYALRIEEEWQDRPAYREVRPLSPWNYALLENSLGDLPRNYAVIETGEVAKNPWSLETVPIEIRTEAVRLPAWRLYNEMAGPIPWSPQARPSGAVPEAITLVPYGSTTLRISAFPTVF